MRTFRRGQYHMIFLDIYMDGVTGMETAAAIRKQDADAPVAFVTTSREHALEANRYHSVLYMEKPVCAADVEHCLRMAEAIMERRKKESLTVTASDHTVYDVPYDDIVMVEAQNHRCLIYLPDGAPLAAVTSITIDSLEKKLPAPPFLRCHRCYIINMRHRIGEDGPDFIMTGGRKAYVRVKDERRMKTACNDYAIALVRGSGV